MAAEDPKANPMMIHDVDCTTARLLVAVNLAIPAV